MENGEKLKKSSQLVAFTIAAIVGYFRVGQLGMYEFDCRVNSYMKIESWENWILRGEKKGSKLYQTACESEQWKMEVVAKQEPRVFDS